MLGVFHCKVVYKCAIINIFLKFDLWSCSGLVLVSVYNHYNYVGNLGKVRFFASQTECYWFTKV